MAALKNNIGVICLFLNVLVNAQTHIFTGNAGNTNWHDVANWSTNSIPTNTSNVLIAEGVTANISQNNVAINSLNISANALLTIDNNLTVTQNLTIVETAECIWNSGAITNATITNNGIFKIETTPQKFLVNTTLNNVSTTEINNSGIVNLQPGTVINNFENATILIDSAGGLIEDNASPILNNNGTITKVNTGSFGFFYLILEMNNSGSIDVGNNQNLLFLSNNQNFNNLENGIIKGDGAFDITSNFINDGIISPGYHTTAIGNLEIVNTFSMTESSTLIIDIIGLNEGEYDRLEIFDDPELYGTVEVNLNFEPNVNDEFTIINSDSNIVECQLPNEITSTYNGNTYVFQVICNTNSVVLKVIDNLSTETFTADSNTFTITTNSNTTTFLVDDYFSNNTSTSISIYSILGKKVNQLPIYKHGCTINNASLSSGLYIAQLQQGSNTLATKKFIIR